MKNLWIVIILLVMIISGKERDIRTIEEISINSKDAWGAQIHPEKYYQEKWCKKQKGIIEFVLPDKTRCDCLTDTHAIEFDFAKKWTEAIGQSLYYSLHTGKKPGIVLIIETEKDIKYWDRLNSTIDHFKLDIKVWKISQEK